MKILLATALTFFVSCKIPTSDVSQDSSTSSKNKDATATNDGNMDAPGFENGMSKEMRDFRDSFLSLPANPGPKGIEESSNAVHERLTGVRQKLLGGKYDGADEKGVSRNDIKSLAYQVSMLIPLRGIVWRLRPILEQRTVLGDGQIGADKRRNAIHSLAVTNLMLIGTGTRIMQGFSSTDVGTDAWKALSRYFAYPYKEMKDEAKKGLPIYFRTIKDAQDYLMGFRFVAKDTNNEVPFYKLLSEAIDGIRAIDFKTPLIVDNKLLFGPQSFPDANRSGDGQTDTDVKDRYTALYQAEKELLLSGLYMTRHNTAYFSAYNWDDFPLFFGDLAKLVGLDGWGPGNEVTGAPAALRRDVLDPYINKGLFAKNNNANRKIRGTMILDAALKDIRRSVDLLKNSWGKAKTRNIPPFGGVAQIQGLWQFGLIPQMQRIGQRSIDELHDIIHDKSIRSAVSGRVLTVKFSNFYGESTAPNFTSFAPGREAFDRQQKTFSIGGFNEVRNYEYGMTTSWPHSVYANYFSPMNQSNDVPKMVRELATSWGGVGMAGPLAMMSFVF